MRRIFLITSREYRRMVSLPGFWIVSLIVPVLVILAPFASSLGKAKTVGYVLVDKSGQYAASIDRRIELDYQRQVLFQLLMYAREWRAGGGSRPEIQSSSQTGTTSSDAMTEAFIAEGGAPAVLRQLKPRLLPTAPPFDPPIRPLVEIPVPRNIDTSDADRFGASIGPRFQESIKTDAGNVALAVAVYIPQNFDSGGQVRVWSSGAAGTPLIQDVRIELTDALRLKALRGADIDPLSAARIGNLNAPVSVAAPEAPARGSQSQIHSRLPQIMAFLLLISMMITGSMMLQGLVEERSNKLIEAVLACVSPRDLMIGKLAGISAIGLSIVGIWMSAAVVIIRIYPSSPLGFLLPALASLGETPWIAAAMFFYFLVGFLTIGMIFLAVGVTRESMQEAQAYLMPIAMVISVPTALGTVK